MASCDTTREEYERASKMLDMMGWLHRGWSAIQPPPPLKRSDVILMGILRNSCLYGGPPVTVSTLARTLHQSAPGISQKVHFLEQQGYIRRVIDKKDRRVFFLELTGEGCVAAENARRQFLGRIEEALDAMGSQGAEQLLARLADFGNALQSHNKENEGDSPKGAMKIAEDCPVF